MPIDANLIGNYLARFTPPPAPPDPNAPLERLARIQALKNGFQQQQLGAQQLQEGALGLQQRQKAIADQDAIDKAFADSRTTDAAGNVTYDRNKVLAAVPGSHVATIQKTFNDADEAQTKAQKAKVDLQDAQNDLGASFLLGVHDSNYEPAAFRAILSHAVGTGAIPAAEGAQMLAQVNQNPTPEAVKALTDPLLARSPKVQATLAARTTADARKKTADIAGDKLTDERIQKQLDAISGAKSQDELNAGRAAAVRLGANPAQVNSIPMQFTPDAMAAYTRARLSPDQRTTTDQAAATAAETKRYHDAESGQAGQRIGIAQQELQLRNQEYQKKYGDALGNLSQNDRDIADKIARGDYPMSILGRLPNKEQIMAAAIQINPPVSQATYDTKQSFTNPEKTQAKNLGTISRIVGHIGRFEENSKAMGFAPAYAAGMNLTGAQSALNEDAHAISGELEKLVSGGVGSEGQIKAWQQGLHSPSAAARQQAVDELSKLIGSQYEGMSQTYKTGVGEDLPITKYLSPAGQQWLNAKGINVGGSAGTPQPATGAVPTITTKTEYDKLPSGSIYLEDGKKYRKP